MLFRSPKKPGHRRTQAIGAHTRHQVVAHLGLLGLQGAHGPIHGEVTQGSGIKQIPQNRFPVGVGRIPSLELSLQLAYPPLQPLRLVLTHPAPEYPNAGTTPQSWPESRAIG